MNSSWMKKSCFLLFFIPIIFFVVRFYTSDSKRDEKYGIQKFSNFDNSCPCAHPPYLFSKENSESILAFVGIYSNTSDFKKREAIRNTWMSTSSSSLEKEYGLVFKFVIDQSDTKEEENLINGEMKKHNDILRLNKMEKSTPLSQKILFFFQHAFYMYDAEFYVKMNDNVYIFPGRLATLLSQARNSSRTYIGCMSKRQVVKNNQEPGYEPDAPLLGNEYILYASGSIYAISRIAAADVVNQIPYGFRMLNDEDATIGLCLLAYDVQYEDDRNFCSPTCTQDAIGIYNEAGCDESCNDGVAMYEMHVSKECSQLNA